MLFLPRYKKSINDDKNDDLHTSKLCLTNSVYILEMSSKSIAGDITMSRQMWRDHTKSDIYLTR